MKPKVVVEGIVVLVVLSLFFACGRSACLNQDGCPDGSTGTGGILGSFLDLMVSTLHRDQTAAQITLSAELGLGTASLPTGYRKFPRIGNDIIPTPGDDEGLEGGNVTAALRPTTTCGTSQSTVAARIADCAAQNPTRATWDGSVSANAAQGSWKLVTYAATHEVWRDERTTLLWSDWLGTTNWCRASGASGGGPYAEVDQYNYCDNVTYQDQVTPESWCTEDAGLSTPATYDPMKGGMRLSATATSPSVVWRLPTMWDFHQAEIDGIRFVLPNMGIQMWSATVFAINRGSAWYFDGTFQTATRSIAVYSVRCVGR